MDFPDPVGDSSKAFSLLSAPRITLAIMAICEGYALNGKWTLYPPIIYSRDIVSSQEKGRRGVETRDDVTTRLEDSALGIHG